ncbi:tetratricopeptide repeat protein [Calothrix sp. PCC 6303]|uniref:tetratricopeptide repeat protein n=1 Tax=Calothrix sp. PCC 6303 TaxID=1170562 RepID=UPI0002A02156|nr:tetratricopeptide repeat protein [Calothrix sp. PCC 6303]AFZ01857.1 NB-ARC domain protein [Calothrix sp. PCC 6303]
MINENWQGINAKGGINVIKDNTFNFNSPEKPATAVNYIPYPGVSHFVGRSEELKLIHEKLYRENNTVAISAVSGMGGIGKTELAVKYAREYGQYYPGGVCWLNTRDANIAQGIIQFVQLQMGLEVRQQDFQGNPLTLIQQVAWCWQNWQPSEGLVLVVLDDVMNLQGFDELIPTNNRFRILLTTRLRDIDANVEEIPLDVLSPEEGLQLLINIIGEKRVNKPSRHSKDERRRNFNDSLENRDTEIASLRRNDGDAQELCKWLGYLPLGIELVGRYIKKKPPHFTLGKMLELLQQQRLEQEAINLQQKGLSTAQRGVLAAFELSWVELSSETQKIAGLLSLFAADIFVWEWVETMTQSLNWDESDVETANEQLYQRHLVQCLEADDLYGYKIHPLIREFLKDKLTADGESKEIKQAFTNTFMEIAQTIPQSPTLEFINSVKTAIPHLTEIAENLTDAVSDENLYWAFTGLALYYNGQGLYGLAEPWYQGCVSALKSRLGENHPDVATSLNNLAQLYDSQVRYEEAEPMYLQALELYKQLLGENHPDVATSLNNLAALYDSQGRYEAAEPLYIQALELYKQMLGENHPSTATSLNNLAALYRSQGRYEAAEPLYIQALELRKQLLGENHPHVAQSLNNLAALYRSQGRYEAAEPLYIQALELRKQLLGENHPHVAQSLNNLASLYRSQGRYEAAEPMCLQALELYKQLLGENHPHVATSLSGLAVLYVSQGRYEAAEPMCLQAFELYKQLLGENHPDVATSLNNLANLYYSQGRYEAAEPLLIEALELYKQLLGENHPNVATSLDNLALLYVSQGRYEAAEPMCLQAFELYKQLLGENHPDVATSLNNLANLYYSQGRYEDAEPMHIQALKICEQSLGVAHPNTMTVRGNYAACLREMSQRKDNYQF